MDVGRYHWVFIPSEGRSGEVVSVRSNGVYESPSFVSVVLGAFDHTNPGLGNDQVRIAFAHQKLIFPYFC